MKGNHFFFFALALMAFTAQSNAMVEIDKFFPFGIDNGDQYLARGDDTSSPRQNLSIIFPFFGYSHTNLWVNVNGAISFNAPIPTYTPTCAPVNHDYRMISPFWADVDTQSEDPSPRSAISFRESKASPDLQKAKEEVVHAFPGFSHINLNWAYVVTWFNVTFYDDDASRSIRNSFQAAITTDGRHSFAIFYYNKIQWTAGEESGGHPEKGIGGTAAQIGFDAGDNHNRTMLEVSCTENVINISSMSNVGKSGTFVFRIDSAEIIKPPSPSPLPHILVAQEQQQCPPNSIKLRTNDSICYSFHPSLSQYVVAERECNEFGANLVSMKNKYISVYITQFANLLFKHLEIEQFWANGHRLIDSETFELADGEDFNYTNWGKTQTPNSMIIDDCVAVNIEKGFWVATDCFARLPFVCEFFGNGKEVPPTALVLEEHRDLLMSLSHIHYKIHASNGNHHIENENNRLN